MFTANRVDKMEELDLKFKKIVGDFEKITSSKRNTKELSELIDRLRSTGSAKEIYLCIAACVKNAERLMADAKRVSKPTGSALIELAMEESIKAYWLCEFYLKFYNPGNIPEWANERYLRELRNRPVEEDLNIIFNIFKRHDLKANMLILIGGLFSALSDIYGELELNIEPGEMIKYKLFFKKLNSIEGNKVKEDGLYINFDFTKIKFSQPKSASIEDVKIIKLFTKELLSLNKKFLKSAK